MRTQLMTYAILFLTSFQSGPVADPVSSPEQVIRKSLDNISEATKTLVAKPSPKLAEPDPDSWIGVDAQGKRVVNAELEKFVGGLPAGTVSYIGIPKPGFALIYRTITVVDGTGPIPPPVVIPPGPAPVPPKPPVVSGAKRVVLIRESLEPTPEMGRLIVLMQSGPIGTYMTEHKHEFESFDKDGKDENGKPSPYVSAWLKALDGLELPAVAIVDVATGNIVDKKSLPKPPTAAGILQLIKENGG